MMLEAEAIEEQQEDNIIASLGTLAADKWAQAMSSNKYLFFFKTLGLWTIACIYVLTQVMDSLYTMSCPVLYYHIISYCIIIFGRPILYTTTTTTTTQTGWCTEVFVSILAHLQSRKLLPGGGGVQNRSSEP